MKKISGVTYGIVFLLVLIISLFGSNVPVRRDIGLSCHYMMYACGECYPQYKVEKIENPSWLFDVTGKDILVTRNVDGDERDFTETIPLRSCYICYDFYFKVDLYFSFRNMNCCN